MLDERGLLDEGEGRIELRMLEEKIWESERVREVLSYL